MTETVRSLSALILVLPFTHVHMYSYQHCIRARNHSSYSRSCLCRHILLQIATSWDASLGDAVSVCTKLIDRTTGAHPIARTHTRTIAHAHTCTLTGIHAHRRTRRQACTHTHTRTHIPTHTRTRARIHTRTHTRVRIAAGEDYRKLDIGKEVWSYLCELLCRTVFIRMNYRPPHPVFALN